MLMRLAEFVKHGDIATGLGACNGHGQADTTGTTSDDSNSALEGEEVLNWPLQVLVIRSVDLATHVE